MILNPLHWLQAVAPIALLACSAGASTLTPPNLPLVVRNPYVNLWLQNARDPPWSNWPIFWTGQEVGLSLLASVPSASLVYPLLGRAQDSLATKDREDYNISYPVYKGADYDASTTNFTYEIPAPSKHLEPLEIIVSFLSPVTPTSSLRQSIPASYISVVVNGGFDVDIYMDVNGLWVSGDRGKVIKWSLETNTYRKDNTLRSWKVSRMCEEKFVEEGNRAEWGSLWFTGPEDARFECGTSGTLRRRFSRTGTLQNEIDNKYRGIMDDEPVFAFSKSFQLSNSTNTTSDSVLFTIAHVQDEVVQYASARGLTLMRPLWKSWFSKDEDLITFHYLDFEAAQSLAEDYSARLARDAAKSHGHEYEEIVALSARQVLGATCFSGTPDNPLLFLKEISSNGNCQTVDVIFPSFPFFMYTNPRWLAYLLEPLLEHQLSGQYPNKYSMHDLGAHFPNMTGHGDGNDEYMPVEECGDMLIMGLALVNSLQYESENDAQSAWSAQGSSDVWVERDSRSVFDLKSLETRDGIFGLDAQWGGPVNGRKQAVSWLKRSYRIWKQWSEYLIEYSLEPENQLSTDDFAGWLKLQTNLALKGIVGINAMSHLSAILGENKEANYYKNISDTYITKWQEYAMTRDGHHAKLAYNWYGSWTTLYSLFADAILCFHPSKSASVSSSKMSPISNHQANQSPLVTDGEQEDTSTGHKHNSTNFIPHEIYVNQSAHYAVVMQKYGLPLDSRHLYTKSDWEFEAAAVASPALRKDLVHRVARWLNETVTNRPFTDLYVTEDRGGFPGPEFKARPVIGAHFSFLALERACGGQGMNAFLED